MDGFWGAECMSGLFLMLRFPRIFVFSGILNESPILLKEGLALFCIGMWDDENGKAGAGVGCFECACANGVDGVNMASICDELCSCRVSML